MSNTRGDIYFRDVHGNFHKLETKDLDNELLEVAGFNNILTSNSTEKALCNYNPLNYYKLNLNTVKNGEINNNRIVLKKGMYKFCIYSTFVSNIEQRIYFFLRNKSILKQTLVTHNISDKIPNNINYSFIININFNEELELGIISEKDIQSSSSYILYTQIN
jgi:hypothetical protein